jgi:hypothetical protein
MANGWTLERRKRQSELIRKWKPWRKSTGPTTKFGKRMSSQNSTKHGMRSKRMIELRSALAEQAKQLKQMSEIGF